MRNEKKLVQNSDEKSPYARKPMTREDCSKGGKAVKQKPLLLSKAKETLVTLTNPHGLVSRANVC